MIAQDAYNDEIVIEPAQKRGPLTVGKPKKILETSLDYNEKLELKKAIDHACVGYKQ